MLVLLLSRLKRWVLLVWLNLAVTQLLDTVQSGLDPNRSNEFSVGLFQVNAQAHGDKLKKLGYTSDDLRDPAKAAQVAKMVYDEVGSFKPWSVYKSGAYTQYMQ